MEKFSVIIPTIWKSEYTIELLERYCASKHVAEVLLINNNKAETPQIFTDYKLKVIEPKENIYVNPAWNKGVYEAKYKHITISNDDILFDVDEYYYEIDRMSGGHPAANGEDAFEFFGFIGSHSENYTLDKSTDVRWEFYDNKNNLGGWGCLFSFHKNNWRPIPEQLKIWYGDNWIHATAANVFQLRGLAIETKMSTSSDLDEVRSVRDNDTIEWHKLLGNG